MVVRRIFNQNSDFLSVIISTVTVAVAVLAIYVPAKIAKRQDKIALYSKRFSCYRCFEMIIDFSNYTANLKSFSKENEAAEDPVNLCQCKYMDLHNLFVDEEVIKYRFDWIRRNIYIRNCLEKDRFYLTSASFLLQNIEMCIRDRPQALQCL